MQRAASSHNKKTLKLLLVFNGNPSQSWGASSAIWDHTIRRR